jgi:hypothetical protein
MCFVEVPGVSEKLWAKLDYYDTDLRYLSDDPSDEKSAERLMTIVLASEH